MYKNILNLSEMYFSPRAGGSRAGRERCRAERGGKRGAAGGGVANAVERGCGRNLTTVRA